MIAPGLKHRTRTPDSCLRQTSDMHLYMGCPKPLRQEGRAIAAADQFGATLAFLSIISARSSDDDPRNWQGDPHRRTFERLTQLAANAGPNLRPELYVEFESGGRVSEKILETAEKLEADLIIMGLHESSCTGVISHLDLATTYEVICDANSPVLTLAVPQHVTFDRDRSNGFAGRKSPSSSISGSGRSGRRDRDSPSTR